MKAFQNLRNALTPSIPLQSSPSSSSNGTVSNKNRTAESNSTKKRVSKFFARLSASSHNRRNAGPIATAKSSDSETSPSAEKKSIERLTTRAVTKHIQSSSPKLQISSPQNKVGFPCELPDDLISDIDIQAKFASSDKKSGVVVTRTLLVLRVEEYSIFYGKLKICDFLISLENEPLSSKKQFYEKLKQLCSSGKEFTLRLQRPLWNTPATRLPKGYDRAPGYNYIRGLMILYPGGNLGMNIKSYNSKVYVTNTDQMSMASAACLMGDCIVDVDGTPVTSTAFCGERVISGLKEKKFVLMTIERAVDAQAIRVVKYVLLVEKVPTKDPRMAQDTTKIGLDEAEKIRRTVLPAPPLKSIYCEKGGRAEKHLVIREMSMFTPIGADPFNPLLMQAVPPKKMDVMHANKSTQEQTSTSDEIQQKTSSLPLSSSSKTV